MPKRMTAEKLASKVFDLIYADGDNRPRAAKLVKAHDKATLEAAANRACEACGDECVGLMGCPITRAILHDEED